MKRNDILINTACQIFYHLTGESTDIADPAIRYNNPNDSCLHMRVGYCGSLSMQDYYARLLRNIIRNDCGITLPIIDCSIRCTVEQLEQIVTFYKLKGIL